MKILVVHEIFPPDVAGGGEKLVLRLAKELKSRGHEIRVLTTGDPEEKEFDGIQTIRMSLNRYMMNLLGIEVARQAAWADVIQTSSGNSCLPAWFAGKVSGKPVVCMVCHIFGPFWKDVLGGAKGALFSAAERFFLSRSYDSVVFLNKSSMEMGVGIGVDARKARILNPGIDFEKFQVRGVKKEPFVLSVGNFSMNRPTVKVKGVEYLMEAARAMPDQKFVVVGTGDALEEISRTSPGNVEFRSDLEENELIETYNRALVFCAPSLAEGFGFTILEAMASGCAVVSTIDLGQSGRVIGKRSSSDIMSEIGRLVGNQKAAEDEGRRNREVAKEYDWDKFVDGMEAVYGSVARLQ